VCARVYSNIRALCSFCLLLKRSYFKRNLVRGTRNEKSREIVTYQRTSRQTDNFYDRVPVVWVGTCAQLWTSARVINHAEIHCVYWGNARATKVIYIWRMMKLRSLANQSEDATGISFLNACASKIYRSEVSWPIDSVMQDLWPWCLESISFFNVRRKIPVQLDFLQFVLIQFCLTAFDDSLKQIVANFDLWFARKIALWSIVQICLTYDFYILLKK